MSHSAFNMTNGQKITPELLGLPAGLASLIPSLAIMNVAVLLVVFTSGRLGHEPVRGAAIGRSGKSSGPAEGAMTDAQRTSENTPSTHLGE